MRTELLERYQALPLPTTRDEHWRFTNLQGFDPDAWRAEAATAAAVPSMLDLDVAASATIDESGIRCRTAAPEGSASSRSRTTTRCSARSSSPTTSSAPTTRPCGSTGCSSTSRRGRAREAALPAGRELGAGRIALLARPRRRRARVALHARPGADLRERRAGGVRQRRRRGRRPRRREGRDRERPAALAKTWLFASCHARVERDAELDWVEGGFGSLRGKVWIQNDLADRGATVARHRRVLRRRGAAPRLRHVPAARGARHDVGLRLQGRAPRHGRDGVARDDPGRGGRAEDERLPGEPQPPALEDRDRELDPRARDPRERRALHARRDAVAGRPRAALLPHGARPPRARRPSG